MSEINSFSGTDSHAETKNCSAIQFEEVKKLIQEFELDDRELNRHQFITLSKGNELLGFGRIREHATCSEMCSLGVIPSIRAKGVGQKLLLALIEKATQPIYLVCIIPSFFLPHGFSICTDYPIELKEKLDYCNLNLKAEQGYVVMNKN